MRQPYLGFERFGERVKLKDLVRVSEVRRRSDEGRCGRDTRSWRGAVEMGWRFEQVVHGERQTADDTQW